MTPGPLDSDGHFEAIARSARDGIVTVSADATIRYANPAVEEIFGYAPAELVGRSIDVLLPPDRAREAEALFDRHGRSDAPRIDQTDVRLHGRHRDGHEVPLSISFSQFERDGTPYFTGIFRDITGQKRRETRLTGLNHLAQDLMEADSAADVCESTIDAADTTLERPIATIELYDADAGRLVPRAWTSDVDEIADEGRLFASERAVTWDAFVAQERAVHDDLPAETDVDPEETPLRSAIVQPIGTYGVFVVGSRRIGAFTDEDVDTTSILVGNVHSALQRVDHERSLRERTDQLEEKTESLERVRRINDVIRDLTKALTRATGRAEITEEVCRRLAESDPYRFAWFGSREPGRDEFVPETRAGEGADFLEEVTITVDDESADPDPTERAIRSRTPQVENDVYSDPPFEPWRRAAIERGFRASIAVPVVYQDTLYGVLHLYAADADVFGQMEIAVLQELGETIGYAFNADERKQAFTSERSVDLAFEADGDGDDPILEIAARTGARLELENLVERRDGSASGFFSVHERDPGRVVEHATERGMDVHLLTDRTDESLLECTLPETTVWAQLLQRGSIVRDAVVAPESTRIEIRIPQSSDPRSYDALLEERLRDVELVARREREEPVMTPEEFEAEFRDRLTERQDEVLQTAYYAGYFEWPRETKSGELANVLGIAQPTVSRHLRAGERKFLSMVYDDS